MDLNYLEIGRNIRTHRQRRKMKQKDLAELINVSDQHISHIENGHTKLSLSSLVAISNALQVDCNTLLGTTLTATRKTVLLQRLADLTSKMDEKRLGFLVEFCNILVDSDLS